MGVRVVALDHRHGGHGLAGDRLDLAFLPFAHQVRLAKFRRAVVHQRGQDGVLLLAEMTVAQRGEALGDAAEDRPVGAALPRRIHRRGQRMDEGMHVRGVEVVLLVPGGRGQHDVGVHAGGAHAEVERHQQVELALRRLVMPRGFLGLRGTLFAEVLALHAVLRAKQVLEEILVPLARGAEQVRPPHEQVARPVGRMVGILAGHLERAGLQRLRHVLRHRHAGLLGFRRDGQRVAGELRGGGQPAHALGADVEVDQLAGQFLRRGGGQDVLHLHRLVAPLVGVRVPEGGRVLLPRRAAPVRRESHRDPAGLRAQLLLAHVVRPAAARLADATAHHQQVDDAAVVHVRVVPVVQRRAEDDHGLALGLLGVVGEFPRHGDDLLARHAADGLGPGRGVGRHGVVVGAAVARHPVVREEQIVDGRDLRAAAVGERDGLHRHVMGDGVAKRRRVEEGRRAVAEIREGHGRRLVALQRQARRHRLQRLGVAALEVPLALLAPAEADRTCRDVEIARGVVDRDGLPVGVVALARVADEIRRAQLPVGHQAPVLLRQHHQHRHVGVATAGVEEVVAPALRVPLGQDDVAHRQRERGIGALLRVQPQVGELRRFRIVGRDGHDLGAAITGFRHEVRVRRARLRHVGPPHHDEAGIVPVSRFRNVGLLAPGLRGGRRQVAVPVVEGHADAADQRQVSAARGVGHHRHRRDRREADDAVRTVLLRGVHVGGGDEFLRFVPRHAHEAAEAAHRLVFLALRRIVLDRLPGQHRVGVLRLRVAPQLHQALAHHRILDAVRAVEIPGIGRPARAAARFMVRQAGPRARVVGLLRLPGHDPALDVDLPGARPGAVRPVGGTHDLVVRPAGSVRVLPRAAFRGDVTMAVGEGARVLLEVGQAVEEMAHRLSLRLSWWFSTGRARCAGRRAASSAQG